MLDVQTPRFDEVTETAYWFHGHAGLGWTLFALFIIAILLLGRRVHLSAQVQGLDSADDLLKGNPQPIFHPATRVSREDQRSAAVQSPRTPALRL